MKPFLEYALDYARRGWPIHPLQPGSKRPICHNWPNLATTDEATIRRWWGKRPQSNVGLCTRASGLVVVDIDVKNGPDGLAAWGALGVDDDTVTSQTPSGGRHLFYAAAEGLPSKRHDLDDGIEILAGNSSAVLPPSVLADGRAYAWLNPPETTRIAPFPEALLERMAGRGGTRADGGGVHDLGGLEDLRGRAGAAEQYGLTALAEEAEAVRHTAPSGRNNRLNLAAFRMGQLVGAGRLDERLAGERLLEAAIAAGLEEEETGATIESGLEAGAKSPRQVAERRRPGVVSAACHGPAPILGKGEEAPPLPEHARLPEELGRDACPWLDGYIAFSRKWSPRSFDGFHEACAVWLLSTVAARRVAVHHGRERYTNLYILLAGRTTLHAKSSATDVARDVLRACGLECLLAADEATPQAFVRVMAGGSPPDNFDRLDAERQAAIKLRLGFAGQQGWYAEEFGSWLASMVRTDGIMADFRGLLRRLDDCPPSYSRSTIARGNEAIDRPYLALIGNLTPADLRPLAKRGTQLWGDGFLARFAFVTPPADEILSGEFPRGERVLPAELIEPLVKWHKRLGLPTVEIEEVTDGQGKPTGQKYATVRSPHPQVCTMTEEVWTALYRYNRAVLELARESDLTDLDGNYGRLHEKALRLAVLLASLDNEGRIVLRHWARAQAVIERWRLYTHRLYAQVTGPEPAEQAEMEEKILGVVRRQGKKYPDGLTAADISRFTWGVNAGEVERCVDGLVEAGALRKQRVKLAERYWLPTAEGS